MSLLSLLQAIAWGMFYACAVVGAFSVLLTVLFLLGMRRARLAAEALQRERVAQAIEALDLETQRTPEPPTPEQRGAAAWATATPAQRARIVALFLAQDQRQERARADARRREGGQ